MHTGQGLKAIFNVKIAENSSETSPERQPSPAKAASSVYAGAGPIRARYEAGCASHRGRASQGGGLQTHLRE